MAGTCIACSSSVKLDLAIKEGNLSVLCFLRLIKTFNSMQGGH